MRKILIYLTFLSLTGSSFAQEKGIKFFQGQNWETVKAKAKAEHKYIFVDVFATWCGPCKQMDKDVYSSEKVGAFMNDRFVSVKVQVDQTKEDSEAVKDWYKYAREIMTIYKINAFPSFLYFSPDGKLANKDGGIKSSEEFISGAAASIDSLKNYNDKVEKFKRRQMDHVMMPELARKAKSLNQMDYARKIANEYINSYLFKLKEQNLYTKENLNFIAEFLSSENSKGFSLFKNEPEKVNRVLGDYRAQMVIMNFIEMKYLPNNETWKTAKPDWNSLEKMVISKFGSLGQERVYEQKMVYYLTTEDWGNYGISYAKYFEKYLKTTRLAPNDLCWNIFEHTDNQKILKFACDVVMPYTIEKWGFNDWPSYDTYANLLYKIGRTDQAIKWEERAVRLSNSNKEIVETLEKMKNNQKTGLPTINKL